MYPPRRKHPFYLVCLEINEKHTNPKEKGRGSGWGGGREKEFKGCFSFSLPFFFPFPFSFLENVTDLEKSEFCNVYFVVV